MSPDDRAVRRWLIASAIAVAIALVAGGITRLTHSGLSITEWKPVRGVLPPMGADQWELAYRSYLRIPEAQTIHRGITLGQFQVLYWWEWTHRLLARGLGLVLALPWFWFLLRGKIRPGDRAKLGLLPLLTLAQGALGWYMVKSGLEVRTDVSPYRLVAHLGLALVIFVVAVWWALSLGEGPHRSGPAPPVGTLTKAGLVGLAATLITMLSGGFVAGTDGGKVYNTFPLMGGRLIPPGYRGLSFEDPVSTQFHHRIIAISTAVLLLVLAARAIRSMEPSFRRAGLALGVAVLVQVGLGIATLLLSVPPVLGVAHQASALAVLTAVILFVHRARGTPHLVSTREILAHNNRS